MYLREYLSATILSKQTAATLNTLEKGDVEKLIILRNNTPQAILMSIDAYAAMEEEMEDLRFTALALARLHTFNPEAAIPHKEMMDKFS